MWKSIVCPKTELDDWHRLECLMGECEKCGADKMPFCENELEGTRSALVEWRRFALEEIMSKKGGKQTSLIWFTKKHQQMN